MCNKPKSETVLLRTAVELLQSELPEGWAVRLLRVPGQTTPERDATLQLSVGGERAQIQIEAKLNVVPAQLRRLLAATDWRQEPTLFVTTYLTKTAQAVLAERGLSYLDVTGNIRLSLERPPLFIRLQGAQREPWREPRSLRSLRGRVAGRVIRALCDYRPPLGVRELAQDLRTSAGMVSRVVNLLDREGLIERGPRGPIDYVDWEKLLRRWTEDYSFDKSNRVLSMLALRGLTDLVGRLKTAKTKYAVTGSIAAQEFKPIAPPRLAMIYAMDMPQLAEELDLETVERGANVLLAEPFDETVFERTWERSGVTYAALSQVVADLLTGRGRSPQEAEALIEWMRANVEEWKT